VRLERLAVLVLLSLLHVVRHGERPRERKWSRRAAAAASGSKFRSRNFVERPVGGAENAIVVPSRGPSLTVWRARDVSRGEVARAAAGVLSARVHAPLARGSRCPTPPRLAGPERAVHLVRALVQHLRAEACFVPARRQCARGRARPERVASPERGSRRRPNALGCAPARLPEQGSVRQEGRVLRAT
jgi:hypothetical protein